MIPPSTPEHTLQLLGSPVLRGPAGPVAGRAAHRRRIALLCILALARGRSVRRERLIGLLWPEHTTDAARHSLSESLYVLRKELGDALSSSGDEVRLDPVRVGCDVAEFEEALEAGDAERAARVYGGPLLEGFYVADAAEFERWVDGERDRLARAYARALEELAEAAEAEGSALRAVDWWRALAVHDPFSSRVALRLVRAFDAAGERAAALRHAEAHAALMREELGVDRDPEMQAVVERLRTEPVRTPAPPPPPRFTIGAAAAAWAHGAEPSSAAAVPIAPRTASSPVDGVDGVGSVDAVDLADADDAVDSVDLVDPVAPVAPVDDPVDPIAADDGADSVDAVAATDAVDAVNAVAATDALAAAASADAVDSADAADPGDADDGADAVSADAAEATEADDAAGRAGARHTIGGVDAGSATPAAAGMGTAAGSDGAGEDGRAAEIRAGVADIAPPGTEMRPSAARPAAGRRAARTFVAQAGLLGLVLGLLMALWNPGAGAPVPAVPPDARFDPRRIAVLYFDDHSPGEALRYLASGLTESLIHELSQVEALQVISRNGVKPYRDRAVPLDSIVGTLRVGSVVEGSLQQSGDSLFVTVQLIDAASGAHLDSRVVGQPMGEVVALQRAVAEEVSASLRRRLGAEVHLRQARAETRSTRALALALQGEEARENARRLAEQREPMDVASALGLLRRADSLLAAAQAEDPRWARPAVARGWVALEMAARPGVPRGDTLRAAAQRAAQRVLDREPAHAGALELRGRAGFAAAVASVDSAGQGARLRNAERDLRAAVAAEPGLASAWSLLSQLLRYRGHFAEADLAARRALAEDAWLNDAADVLHSLYGSALMLGDYAAAGAWCARGGQQFPADWRLLECRLTLLREDPAGPADPAAAWRLVEQLERLDPPARARAEGRGYSPVYRRAVAAGISARAGDADRARAELARARQAVAGDTALAMSLAYDEAYVRLMLGERRAARALLDRMAAARPALGPYLRRDPLFRDLFTPSGPSAPPGKG